ncbi:MAG TPA: FRG domain-containing protein [Methanosarcinaceae archaeon]|nr:FRG domain-containing protein [Methanosarcinaceae archaeon]
MTAPLDYWDYEKIPIWNNEGKDKRFEIMADVYSGRIPVTRIENWRHFTPLLDVLENEYYNRIGTKLIFRGHRRYDWSITPTLGRLTPSEIVTQRSADYQLAMFRQTIRGRTNDHSLLVDEEQEDELWSIGQHHGLMTPLLDWTHSPYVALFFAFSEEDNNYEKDNPYRVVYVLNKTFVADEKLCPDIRVFEPKKDDYGRLVSQAGLFTFSPYDATIENKLLEILGSEEFGDDELRRASEEDDAEVLAKYICKIYIKNEDRQGCLNHLHRMNVHPASLFPDLIGASEYCNIVTTEQERLLSEKTNYVAHISEVSDHSEANEIVEHDVDHHDINTLIDLLRVPEESHDVESGRIQLIAEELSKMISKNKLVDWQTRETIQAEIRNTTRVLLRNYDYPVAARDYVIDNVLSVETEMKDEQGEATNE